MVSKEEKLLYSLSALKEVIETFEIDVEVTLTKDGNKHTINAYEEIERYVVECINNTQPYKFEDLQAGMYLYDVKKDEIIYLFKPLDWHPTKGLRYSYEKIDHSAYGFYMDFEENRFFPVQMANVRCE